MRKGIRHIDIAFGDVVYYHAWASIEHGLNPDVEEVLRRNQEAKVRACPHASREKVVGDDWGDYWICRDCSARVDTPPIQGGTFRLSGLLWRANP